MRKRLAVNVSAHIYVALIAFLALGGCERSERRGSLSVSDGVITWEEMKPGDVLARINGTELTKSTLEDIKSLQESMVAFKLPSATKSQISDLMYRRLPQMATAFMNRSLFLDEAERLNIVATEADVEVAKEDFLRQFGVETRPTFTDFRKSLDSRMAQFLDDEMNRNARVQALLRECFPNEYAVPTGIVAEVAADVAERNARAKKANAVAMEKARRAMERIKAGEDFSAVAEDMSEVGRDEDALWGELSPEEIEDNFPDIFEAVAKLPVGGVTDILELDDAIHIVALFGRRGSGRESIVNNDPEMWDLGEIVVKLPMFFRIAPTSDVIATQRDTQLAPKRKEMFVKCREQAQIEYPNGTNVWKNLKAKLNKKKSFN